MPTQMAKFIPAAQEVLSKTLRCIEKNMAFEAFFEEEAAPIYVKSSDLKIMYSNGAYQSTFAPDASPIGRTADAFLRATIVPVSRDSDDMILRGCTQVFFDHFGHAGNGQAMLLRTAKLSLQAAGHPSFAILGITVVKEVVGPSPDPVSRMAILANQWKAFCQLSSTDREVAVLLARGMNPMQIAGQLDVSKRTVENHRGDILRTLGLESPVDLIKLLVRLQERGFGDLGV